MDRKLFSEATLLVPFNVPLLIIPELISRIPALTSYCKRSDNTNDLDPTVVVHTDQQPSLIVKSKTTIKVDCNHPSIYHNVSIGMPTDASTSAKPSTSTTTKKTVSTSSCTSNQYNEENNQFYKYQNKPMTGYNCEKGLTTSMPNITENLIQVSPDSSPKIKLSRLASVPVIKVTDNPNTKFQNVNVEIEYSPKHKLGYFSDHYHLHKNKILGSGNDQTNLLTADMNQPNPSPMRNYYLEPFPWLKYINMNTSLLATLLMTVLLVGVHFMPDSHGILVYLFYGGRKICNRLFPLLWMTMSKEVMKTTNDKLARWWNTMMNSESCFLSPLQFIAGLCD